MTADGRLNAARRQLFLPVSAGFPRYALVMPACMPSAAVQQRVIAGRRVNAAGRYE